MVKDRDLDETGEALLAALAEHSPETPALALREPAELKPLFPIVLRRSQLAEIGKVLWKTDKLEVNARVVIFREVHNAHPHHTPGFYPWRSGRLSTRRYDSKATLRSPTDDSPTAPYGKVFTRPDMPYVVAMAGRLSPAPSGQEYHLYLDDRRIGTITPNESGFGYFVYRADAVGIAYQQARVVLEPPQTMGASGRVVLTWTGR